MEKPSWILLRGMSGISCPRSCGFLKKFLKRLKQKTLQHGFVILFVLMLFGNSQSFELLRWFFGIFILEKEGLIHFYLIKCFHLQNFHQLLLFCADYINCICFRLSQNNLSNFEIIFSFK